MERRRFLRNAALGAAGGSLVGCGSNEVGADAGGAPAAAGQRVRWRLASSFPRSSDIIYRAAETLSERVAALTDGAFEIRPYPAGKIVPSLQVLDAVQNRTVAIGHTAGYYLRRQKPGARVRDGRPVRPHGAAAQRVALRWRRPRSHP